MYRPQAINANIGSPTAPVETISAGLAIAANSGGTRNSIRLASGTYNSGVIVDIRSNVLIEGGFETGSPECIKNSSSVTILNFSGEATIDNNISHIMGMRAIGTSNWTLQDLTIRTSDAIGQTTSGNGKSNYALWLNGASDYKIIRCIINSGAATNGFGATSGWQGSSTFNGNPFDPYDGNRGQNGNIGFSDNPFNGCDGGFIDDDQDGGMVVLAVLVGMVVWSRWNWFKWICWWNWWKCGR
ncbi:MAG: hypothetical protein IPG85_18275 [Bacteroidetes bacterium]|nr:hypothetical protein [Bacteroidota bacterium]